MASFTVETTKEEQDKVLEAIKQLQGATVPVRVLAEKAGMSQSRARYALIDLIEAKKVARVASKAFNKHYCRYYYKTLDPQEAR